MMRRLAPFATCQRGASAVEFGLISLPLLLFIFGTMEYGRMLWTREALQQTAIAGARCMGMVQSACGSAGVYNATMSTSYVQAQAASWSIPLSSSNIALNASTSCGGITGFSQVALTYSFTSVAPSLITALGSGAVLTAQACFPNHP